MAGTDAKAVNSFDQPHQIKALPVEAPKLADKAATISLPPLSFTAVELTM
jgi:hypothetical protein